MKRISLCLLISILTIFTTSCNWSNPFSLNGSTYVKLEYEISGIDNTVEINEEDLVNEIIKIINKSEYFENETTTYDASVIEKGFDYKLISDTNYFYFNSYGSLLKYNKTVGNDILIEEKSYYWTGNIASNENFTRLLEIFDLTIE